LPSKVTHKADDSSRVEIAVAEPGFGANNFLAFPQFSVKFKFGYFVKQMFSFLFWSRTGWPDDFVEKMAEM
jgi:hypothetical protein